MTDSDPTPLGGEGKTVEVDETFYGIKGEGPKWILHPRFGWQRVRAGADMMKFVTLGERGGKARSVKVENLTAKVLRNVVLTNADTKSALNTGKRISYRAIGRRFANHEAVEWRIVL
jgi:hypothetical protein